MKLSTADIFKNTSNKNCIILEGKILKQYQEVLRQIVDDIAYVCEKNHITYTLGGGSALGALRHQGIIPWDDDMDLNMLRCDLEKFIPLFRRYFGNKYWIHTPEYTKNYGLLFVQIRKKGTIARGREDYNLKECGIGIDIFPVENTYDNKLMRTLHGFLCMSSKFALSCRKLWTYRKEMLKLVKSDKNAINSLKLKIILGFFFSFFSIDIWTHITNNFCKMCKYEGELVVIPSGRKQFTGEIYKRKIYTETILVSFDGRRYRLLKNADKYMRQLYGDYMKIPPEEKREHHILYELKF